MQKPEYLRWIIKEDAEIVNYDSKIKCFKLDHNEDPAVLDDWAIHVRRHFVSDDELKEDCEDVGLSVEEYLRTNIIPQKDDEVGPAARANYITEILIADLLEFVYGFSVPRCKQHTMSGKTVSEHGTDVIAYKFSESVDKPSEKDVLVAAEVKAVLSKKDTAVVKNAINDSIKDEYRVSMTLNYMRKKLKMMGKRQESKEVRRFQNKPKNDYRLSYVAAGITSLPELVTIHDDEKDIDISIIPNVDGNDLVLSKDRKIFFVHGKKLMELTHEVFERCTK